MRMEFGWLDAVEESRNAKVIAAADYALRANNWSGLLERLLCDHIEVCFVKLRTVALKMRTK